MTGQEERQIYFLVTGSAAYQRIKPLVPSDWIPVGPYAPNHKDWKEVDFLWENAPRSETKGIRDRVRAYSHLPNGTRILDNKWVLARLLVGPHSLETKCFKGRDGFTQFASQQFAAPGNSEPLSQFNFKDLQEEENDKYSSNPHPPSPKLWFIKDAQANGAGGLWMVGSHNWHSFAYAEASPLIQNHHYVAQTYAWPPVLYGGRKAHVRAYGVMTGDGGAYLHEAAFLHVANEVFSLAEMGDSTHVTNCCANSHDASKFAGEICANLRATEASTTTCGQPIVPLGIYWQALETCLREFAEVTSSYVQGGEVNGGFEYLGMDFILSHDADGTPRAYILEVNAPPSQDTATGLNHAEDLHSRVIRDLLNLWVLPKVTGSAPKPGGWHKVHMVEVPSKVDNGKLVGSDILPSKSALLNALRWTLAERKFSRYDQQSTSRHDLESTVAERARQCYAYFDSNPDHIFVENAGGTQVPRQVIQKVTESLNHRERDSVGVSYKEAARSVLGTLLGADNIFLGANATSLLRGLAHGYQMSGFCDANDEIVIATDNHQANIRPWEDLASTMCCVVRWWDPSEHPLTSFLSEKTRIIAIPHASNILGELRDLPSICRTVRETCGDSAHVIVDGVASAPHVFADFTSTDADWYVVSMHKLFAPHIGALCGSKRATCTIDSSHIETGTVSYEACAGVVGLGEYWNFLSCSKSLNTESAKETYRMIRTTEERLIQEFFNACKRWPNVKVVESGRSSVRIPVISIQHGSLSSRAIVQASQKASVICRQGYFLASEQLQEKLGSPVVRFSFAHYNTMSQIERLILVLEEIPGWS